MEEREWKHLRTVKPAALQRLCERILGECTEIIADTGRSAHERYLALFALVHDGNDEVAAAFDDLRRSNADHKLAVMRALGLVTDEEMEGFSPPTRERVQWLADELHRPRLKKHAKDRAR